MAAKLKAQILYLKKKIKKIQTFMIFKNGQPTVVFKDQTQCIEPLICYSPILQNGLTQWHFPSFI